MPVGLTVPGSGCQQKHTNKHAIILEELREKANISCLSPQGKATTPDPTAKEEDSTTLQIFQL